MNVLLEQISVIDLNHYRINKCLIMQALDDLTSFREFVYILCFCKLGYLATMNDLSLKRCTLLEKVGKFTQNRFIVLSPGAKKFSPSFHFDSLQ